MNNHDLANVFNRIADLLEIKGENQYKILAYRKVADSLLSLVDDVEDIWKAGNLRSIPGVGQAIADKIDELLRTGKLGFLESLEAEIPPSLIELTKVPDLGPKRALALYQQAGIKSLADLEAAARAGKLKDLPGMGAKTEARILAGIEILSRRSDRTPLGRAWPFAVELVNWLKSLPGVQNAHMVGSLRRMKATIGDVDLIAATNDPLPVMDAYIKHPRVVEVYGHGVTKSSVLFSNGMRSQLWIYPPEQYGTALQFTTGSKEHSVRTRELAQRKGMSLTDQALIQPDGTELHFATEEEVYAALGMRWMPPEIREDRGEVEASLKGQLPILIELSDIKADLHMHTTWSDGKASVKAMAEAAIQCGYRVVAITDHSGSLGVAGGLAAEDLLVQRREIEAVQKELGSSIRILQGAEVEILTDGSLDYPDEVLARLDIVIASLHSGLRQPREQVTDRLIRVMRNPHVDIIGHPSGRLIPNREGADLDMDAVLAVAKETGVALEINAHPSRLDLEDIYARRAAELGIPISINTDSHAPDQLDLIHFGVAVARRGWLEARHVINTWEPDRLINWLTTRK